MILKQFFSFIVRFDSIVMLKTYDTKVICLTVELLFCSNVLHIFVKKWRHQLNFFAAFCKSAISLHFHMM